MDLIAGRRWSDHQTQDVSSAPHKQSDLPPTMRFTDGLWLKRAGVDFRAGVEVAEVLNKDEKTGIDYLVACRHIGNRGDSMDGESSSRRRLTESSLTPLDAAQARS